MNEILIAVDKAAYGLSGILYFAQGYLFFRILCCMAERRNGKLWSIAVYLSCTAISSMIIFPNDLFNIMLDLIWFLAMMLLAFRGNVWQKLAAVSILYPLVVSQNFLVIDLLGNLWIWSGRTYLMDIFCTLADTCLHLFFWYTILRVFEKRLFQMKKLFDHRTWILLDAICLASMVSITTCICFSPEKSSRIWPAAFACFATNLGSLFLAEYFTVSIQRNMERKNLMLQKIYYEELEQNQAQVRRLRHDMNNHLTVLRSLLDSGSLKEADQYLKDLETRMTAGNRAFCKNSIVNAVLNAKYNLAVEHGIDCFFHIDLQKLTGIDAVSLCCLFSNTLDNAIEASVKIPDPHDRHISVKARVTENGYFTYEITNAKKNAVLEQKGILKSDKEDPAAHGLGLSSVWEVVEKYSGTLDLSYTEDTFTVTVLIGNA